MVASSSSCNDASTSGEGAVLLPTRRGRQALSVAPMMDWTDLHYRQLARLLSKRTWLWTEMVVDSTVIHTENLDKHLWFPPEQSPLVLQLGGSDPAKLAAATAKALAYGYDEINLNCGCPSDRVAGAGCFGASMMLQPELVAACMKAIGDAAQGTPVTVKCRLGVDEADSYDALKAFVATVSDGSPVTHFIVHARKCFLSGLNPQQNRTVPPLRHEWVYSLKRDFPHLSFSLNGGVQDAAEAAAAILCDGPFPTPGYVDCRGEDAVAAAAAAGAPAPQRRQREEEEEEEAGGPQAGTGAAPACGTSAESGCVGGADALARRAAGDDHGAAAGESAARSPTEGAAGGGGEASGAAAASDSNGAADVAAGDGGVAARSPTEGGRAAGCGDGDGASGGDGGARGGGGTRGVGTRGLIEGVMIGRAAFHNPWGVLGDADRSVFGEAANAAASRRQVLDAYCIYADSVTGRFGTKRCGTPNPSVRNIAKPLLNLFFGEKGSKRWKSHCDNVLAGKDGEEPKTVRELLDRTLHLIPDDVLDAPPTPAGALPPLAFGSLAEEGDRAGMGQSLSALRRAVKADEGRTKGGMRAAPLPAAPAAVVAAAAAAGAGAGVAGTQGGGAAESAAVVSDPPAPLSAAPAVPAAAAVEVTAGAAGAAGGAEAAGRGAAESVVVGEPAAARSSEAVVAVAAGAGGAEAEGGAAASVPAKSAPTSDPSATAGREGAAAGEADGEGERKRCGLSCVVS